MCGVLGFFSQSNISNINLLRLKKASNLLLERGPDYLGTISDKNFFLSNSRLKIVSKKDIKLPLFKHSNYIAFSGEILNFKYLKILLKEKGYVFFTDTDTEVILSLYDCYGIDFVKYLKGFFSIAIYDLKKKIVMLVVDRIGNKSIFYQNTKNNLLFSSQQSYLVRSGLVNFDINKKKIDEFIVFGDVSGEDTLHLQIKKLLPGEILIYDFEKIKKFTYYKIEDKIISENLKKKFNLGSSVDKMHQVLNDTIKLWSNNCAYKKSILLSGGIDSGLLAMLLKSNGGDIKSFTANILNKNLKEFNEYDEVMKIQRKYKIENELINFDEEDIFKNLYTIYSTFEEPLPSSSLLLYKLSQYINKKSKNRICFTGDGSDEIFGGYIRHQIIKKKFEQNNDNSTIAFGLNFLTVNRLKKFFNKDFKITDNNRYNYLNNLKNISTLNKILLYDIKFYLPIFLRSTEIIGMLSSIEYRAPFTDHLLIEKSFQINDNYKLNKLSGKIILKKIFNMYLKKKIKKKKLFSTPFISQQFKSGYLKNFLIDLNNNSKISNYFSIAGIKKMLNDHERNDNSNTLMRLVTLELFLRSKNI